MKDFNFSLEKVRVYKEQIEENLRGELSEILALIKQEEIKLKNLEDEHTKNAKELEEEKRKGCTILRVQVYEGYLLNTTYKIKNQIQHIKNLEIKAQEKRDEVIEAKKETASLDKLKERKYSEYEKILAKAQEEAIDEFVNNSKSFKKNYG